MRLDGCVVFQSAKGNSTTNTAEKAASNASTSVGRAPTAPSQPSPLSSTTTLVANDDERLKLRLDKVILILILLHDLLRSVT